jgi:NTE family protein
MPNKIFSVYFFFLFLFIFGSVSAYGQSHDTTKSKRPTVGLVLSGGGAKGWAYLGVLRVLQEAGLEVDYIAGASAGSIVGGMYALGYHPDTIERIIRSQDWDAVMKDVIDRKYISFDDKTYGGRYIFTLPIKEKKIGLKSSLYEGQNIDLLLNRYYSVAYKDTLFKDFQTPFVCIGTDLYDGKQVVLDRGYLPMAIRSSMAIPAYFSPVDYQGYYLVDGGVVNNYPVTPLKELGVDIIVGLDVQSGEKRTKKDLQNLTTILDQIIGYHRQEENEKGKLQTDLYVHLKMNYSMMDFNNYDSIINFGERIARENFTKIKALADSLNAIEYKPLKSYKTVPLDSISIYQVKYTGYKKMRRKYLETIFGGFNNRNTAISDIEEAITYAYGTGFFQSVFYELEFKNGKTNLIIKVKESEPGNLSAGIHYDTDYKGSVLANLTVRNVLGRRSKLFIDLLLGTYPRLKTLYLIDNGSKPGFGFSLDFWGFDFDLYNSDNRTEKESKLQFINYKGSVFTPVTIRNDFNFKLGFEYEYFRFRQDYINDTILDEFSDFSSYGNLYVSFGADTRDKQSFSTRGAFTEFKIKYILPFSKNWSSELFTNTLILYLKYSQNIKLARRFTLRPGLFLGYTSQGETAPVQHWFWVGGLNEYNYLENHEPFTGLKFIQSYGFYTAIGRLKLQYNFIKNFYATLMADVGQNQIEFDDFLVTKNIIVGYGLKVSYNSFVGPVEIAFMGSNLLPGASVFFSVGYWL